VSLSPRTKVEPQEETARLAELALYALSQSRNGLSQEMMTRLRLPAPPEGIVFCAAERADHWGLIGGRQY